MVSFRPEFSAALTILAKACEEMFRDGHSRPFLVGGATVEFYTGGRIVSGDFDFVSGAQQAFEDALVKHGFLRENRPGRLRRGLYHPELELGVEVVSGFLFDGRTDKRRILLLDIDGNRLALPPIEDVIADRLGQHVAIPLGVSEMRDQAVALYVLAGDVDKDYLDRRIREETAGSLSFHDLEKMAEDGAQDYT